MLIEMAAVLAFKFGVRLPRVLGMLPARYYIGDAVRCLRRDDLDGAMACYRTAHVKNPDGEEVKVLHEVLTLEMKHRLQALTKRREALAQTLAQTGDQKTDAGTHLTHEFCERELAAAEKAMTIIAAFQEELAGKIPATDRSGHPIN